MKNRDLIVVALATFCLTAVLFMTLPTKSNPGIGEYDPWNDLNDDGAIDIYDAINLAGTYGTSGDPTKNVNVMNWPTATETTVWYSNTSYTLNSTVYNASGFNYLRVFLGILWAGSPSSIEFRIYGVIWNTTNVEARSFIAYSTTIAYPRNTLAMTIPVPSENFYFYIDTIEGHGNIFMNFCLTWT